MSFQDFEKIVSFKEKGLIPQNGFFVELGAQELSSKPAPDLVAALVKRSRPDHAYQEADFNQLSNEQYAHPFYEALGFSSVSFDLAEAPHRIPIDLNTDSVPPQYMASSDLTTNFGTTEHILNQLNCFRFVHDITKVGGLMWHILPLSDYF
jgi:hypothetical protein